MPKPSVATHDICLVIADMGCGGAQRVASQLAGIWAGRGQRVCVITLSDGENDFFSLPANVRRVSLHGRADSNSLFTAIWRNLKRLHALRSALRQSRAKHVVSFVGAINILTVLASRGLGVRVVISERNDPRRQSLGRFWDQLRRWIYPRADVVTANSYDAVEALSDFVPRGRLAFVPNPVAIDETDCAAPLTRPTILNVGRLTHQKAQDVLIDAFALIADEFGNWELAIAGTGEIERSLRERAAEAGIAERVVFLGQVKNLFDYYRSAEIFALPSRFEGTPNAVLEAMSCGLSVIVSSTAGGALQHVENDVTGVIVSPGDPAELATALKKLMSDPGLRRRLGAAAGARIEQYQSHNVVAAWDEILFPEYTFE